MTTNTLNLWHDIVRTRDVHKLNELLSEDVVFYSPVVHTPQVGKEITMQYLTAAFAVFFNETFRYTRELINERNTILEFQVEIEDIVINGVDMLQWDDTGKVVEFKVMIRPLKAINLIHQKMAAILARQQK